MLSSQLWAMSGTPNQLDDVIPYPIKLNEKPFDVQGHRGAKGLYGPGNTHGDIQAAINTGINSFEIDVQITNDNVVVLGHDDNISLTCSWAGAGNPPTNRISNMLFADQQKWDCESKLGIQPYPTLPELLNYHQKHDLVMNIEIKSSSTEKGNLIANQVMDYNTSCSGCLDNKIRFSSFNWPVLKNINSLGTQRLKFDIGALTAVHTVFHVMDAANFATVYSPSQALLTQSAVQSAKTRGLKVIPYTVNDQADWDKFIGYGVDGIITDYPNRLATHVLSKDVNQPLPNNTEQNLIENSSFETQQLNQWQINDGQWEIRESSLSFEGANALTLNSAYGEIIQTIDLSSYAQNITHGLYFVVRGHAYGDGDSTRMMIEFINHQGDVVSRTDSFHITGNGNWQLLQNIRQAPADTVSARLRLSMKDEDNDGTVTTILDDFVFAAVNP